MNASAGKRGYAVGSREGSSSGRGALPCHYLDGGREAESLSGLISISVGEGL